MKKTVVLATLAVATLAGTAFGQGANDFRLDLAWVHRTGNGSAGSPLTDGQTGGVLLVTPGTRYCFELRYRITDLNPQDTRTVRGLSSAPINIGRTQAAWITTKGDLTNDQSGDNAPQPTSGAVNPDGSGLFGAPGALTGLINEFRGGLADPDGAGPLGPDDAPSNGNPINTANDRFTANPTGILPLAISAGGVNNHRSDTAPQSQMWGVYFLWIDVPAGATGDNLLTATAVPDATTQNRFGAFVRTGAVTDVVPQTSVNATDGSITLRVIPAPGSLALLGLGGLVAARRRRA